MAFFSLTRRATLAGKFIRQFVITYYFADKSISIYEQEIKNNGFTPGKFIEKMKYKNQRGKLISRQQAF